MLLLEAKAEMCRRDLHYFVKTFWSECDPAVFVDGELVEYLCECFMYSVKHWLPDNITRNWISDEEWAKIEGSCPIRDRNVHNHIVNMPPRHMKSKIFNVFGPVWLLLNVQLKVASISHNTDLSTTMNNERKMIVNSTLFQVMFPDIKLVTDTTKKLIFSTGAVLYSISMKSFTGFGADMIINDDIVTPIASNREAGELENARNYYRDTMPSRRNDIRTAVIWNIQQRLGVNDVTGMIIEDKDLYNTYSHTVLQAIATEPKTIKYPCSGRTRSYKVGESLWKERFEDYATLKVEVGPVTFGTQYQQDPEANDNTLIKQEWILKAIELGKTLKLSKYYDYCAYSYDLAVKGKETSDFNGIVRGFFENGVLFIDKASEKRMNYPAQRSLITQILQIDPKSLQIIEDKANGSPMIDDLSEYKNIIPFKPGSNSKQTRLEIASYYLWNGKVAFLNPEDEGMQNLFKKLIKFPNVDHDDVTDAFSQLVIYVFVRMRLSVYNAVVSNDNYIYDFKEVPKGAKIFSAVLKNNHEYKACKIYYYQKEYVLYDELSTTDVEEVFEYCKGSKLTFDISENGDFHALYNTKLNVVQTRYGFNETVNLMKNALVKRVCKINNKCKMARSDLLNFKYSEKKEEGMYQNSDEIAGSLRVIIAYFKGIKGGAL